MNTALLVGSILDDAVARLQQRGIVRQAPVVEARAWADWLAAYFAPYLSDATGALLPFAPYHAALWTWVWALTRGVRPAPFIAVWPRGAGKSTTAELACVAVAARQTRRYALMVCSTQDRSDDHVTNVASMLESPAFAAAYPSVAARLVSRYGASRGWRRNRVRTASGFTLDAIGLDTAARGAKVEEDRPDLIILDDLDEELDTPRTTARKATTLTRALLPAGSPDVAVLAVQNLVHGDSLFAQLADGRAEFLAERQVSGPHPALEGLAYDQRDGRTVLTAGTPTWAGLDLPRCQAIVADIGITAFRAEYQHEVLEISGGVFDHVDFPHCAWDALPDFVRVSVWCDPAVSDTDASDCYGIQAGGLALDDRVYALWSWEDRTSPADALRRAILKAVELGADTVGVETDQGGDTWATIYANVAHALLASGQISYIPTFRAAKAGAGHGPKAHRAQQLVPDYERGRIVHALGTHTILERALRRFPKAKPFDLVDAWYWTWWDLGRGGWAAY